MTVADLAIVTVGWSRMVHVCQRLNPATWPGGRPEGLRWRRRYHSHVDQLEAQAVDPLQESLEGALIWQFGPKRRGTRAHTDFAVVEFRAQGTACLANESDLIRF